MEVATTTLITLNENEFATLAKARQILTEIYENSKSTVRFKTEYTNEFTITLDHISLMREWLTKFEAEYNLMYHKTDMTAICHELINGIDYDDEGHYYCPCPCRSCDECPLVRCMVSESYNTEDRIFDELVTNIRPEYQAIFDDVLKSMGK